MQPGASQLKTGEKGKVQILKTDYQLGVESSDKNNNENMPAHANQDGHKTHLPDMKTQRENLYPCEEVHKSSETNTVKSSEINTIKSPETKMRKSANDTVYAASKLLMDEGALEAQERWEDDQVGRRGIEPSPPNRGTMESSLIRKGTVENSPRGVDNTSCHVGQTRRVDTSPCAKLSTVSKMNPNIHPLGKHHTII